MKTESAGLFSRIGSNPFMAILVLCFLGLLAVVAVIMFKLRLYAEQDQNLQSIIADLRASSFELSSLARDASNGEQQAFDRLEKVVGNMDQSWSEFKKADNETRAALAAEMTSYEGVWSRMRENAEIITNNQDSILLMHGVARTLSGTLPKLQSENDNVVDILLDTNARAEQVSRAQRQTWFAERIGRNVDKMLRGGLDVEKAADEFNKDANLFTKVISGLIDGDVAMGIRAVRDSEAKESLQEMRELFDFVSTKVNEIFTVSPDLALAREATTNVLDGSPLLQQRLVSLNTQLESLPAKRKYNEFALMVVGALALVCLLVLFWQLNVSTKRRLRSTAETNERNQNAILRLLDELADLADGDLTTTATVTEDFTGAIADSINYTIDQLRVLVSNINDTSVQVSGAAQETQQTALHLAEASEHQAQEIAGASAAVNEMAVTIDQVSANAAESAGVAERSVSIASNGAKVVQNTIHGMDTIREQIQDTSKRIKRLGESSQEIGDIVSLINDIADQTNILALNAAIQASMAGEAGRGFAVVADEVQRLAERSAAATKQIEALVKTIQNDTNEAVISMETTTSEVVRGARLAQDAGVALEEIETVSANLAELIQNISNAARQQAASAGHISNTMNVIQEITSQTSAGTTATATAIGTLANMAVDLRESVAGFNLPEEMITYTPEQLANLDEAMVSNQDNDGDVAGLPDMAGDEDSIETLSLDDESHEGMQLSDNGDDEALLDLSLDDAIDEFNGDDEDHSDDDRARA